MRTEQIAYLDSVIRLGSFRAAARHLGVSQPTLTEQIRRLEEELDVTLLTRQHSGVSLTTAGEHLLPHIQRLLQDSRSLHEEANALSTLQSGSVRIGGTPTLNYAFLVSSILEYRRMYPNVRFEAIEAGSRRLIESVLSGDLDIAVVTAVEDLTSNKHLIARPLFRDEVVMCLPATHRLAGASGARLRDLKDDPWVVFGWDFMLRQLLEELALDTQLNVVYNASGSASTVRMVAMGIGITLTTMLAIKTASVADRERVVSLPLLGSNVPTVHSYLIRRRGLWPTPASRELERIVMRDREERQADGMQ